MVDKIVFLFQDSFERERRQRVKIARIKGEKLGGWIVAIYDLASRSYTGIEMFILPGSKEATARQLKAVLQQFERSGIGGILQDLLDLCKQHGVAVNPQWTVYVPQKCGNPSQ